MQGTGRVGRNELHLSAPTRPRITGSKFGSAIKNGADNFDIAGLVKKKVDEAGARDLCFGNEVIGRQCLDNRRSKVSGRFTGLFRQHHG